MRESILPKPTVLLALAWESIPEEQQDHALEIAYVEGRRVADTYYGTDPLLLDVNAPGYYTEVVNQSLERGDISSEDFALWMDKFAVGDVSDPRVLRFSAGLRDRLNEWQTVRDLGGEKAVQEMVRAASQTLHEPEPAEEQLVLHRSEDSNGAWSLYAPGTSEDLILSGEAAALLSGSAEWDEVADAWDRPNEADFEEARSRLTAGD